MRAARSILSKAWKITWNGSSHGSCCAAIGSAALLATVGLDAQAQTFQFPPPSPAPRPIEASPAPAPPTQQYAAPAPARPAASPTATNPTPVASPGPASHSTSIAAQPVPTSESATSPSSTSPSSTSPPIQRSNLAAWPPAVLPYRDDMPIPPGYHLESHINSGLVYGGLAVWAAPYFAGLAAAAASGFAKGSSWLALPLAGPFLAMGGRSIDCSVLDISTSPGGTDVEATQDQCRKSAIKEARVVALLTLDGLLQATGAIMTVAGFLSPSEALLRNDVFPTASALHFDAGYSHGQFRMQARMRF